MSTEITLCFTCYRNITWIIWNLSVISKLNRKTNYHIVIVNSNSFVKFCLDKIIVRIFLRFNSKQVISNSHVRNTKSALKYTGSKQHGSALDSLESHIKTRYVAILDPDFIVLKKDWIDFSLDLLKSSAGEFFGFPQALEESNHSHKKTTFDYKFKSPLAFFLIGLKDTVFNYSFAPLNTVDGYLDVGHELSRASIKGDVQSILGESYSTRNTPCEIEFINSFNCTFHRLPLNSYEVFGCHYGRSSNPMAKRNRNLTLVKQFFLAYFEPVKFRNYIFKYLFN